MWRKFIRNNGSILVISMLAQVLLRDFLLSLSHNFLTLAMGILPVLWLPLNVSAEFGLIYSFITGFICDALYLTPGLHASVFVFVAFCRRLLLVMLRQKSYFLDKRISSRNVGLKVYIIYLFSLFLIYAITLTVIEFWDFRVLKTMAASIFCSTLLNTALVTLADVLTTSSTEHKEIS